jgi:hypothetical protein
MGRSAGSKNSVKTHQGQTVIRPRTPSRDNEMIYSGQEYQDFNRLAPDKVAVEDLVLLDGESATVTSATSKGNQIILTLMGGDPPDRYWEVEKDFDKDDTIWVERTAELITFDKRGDQFVTKKPLRSVTRHEAIEILGGEVDLINLSNEDLFEKILDLTDPNNR